MGSGADTGSGRVVFSGLMVVIAVSIVGLLETACVISTTPSFIIVIRVVA